MDTYKYSCSFTIKEILSYIELYNFNLDAFITITY